MRKAIDPLAAIRLYNEGWSWREIGIILARKHGRRSPFQDVSVQRVVKAYHRRQATTAVEASSPSNIALLLSPRPSGVRQDQ